MKPDAAVFDMSTNSVAAGLLGKGILAVLERLHEPIDAEPDRMIAGISALRVIPGISGTGRTRSPITPFET
jgi:hypothetical protein